MESLITILLGLLKTQFNISEEQAAELVFPKSEDDDTKLDRSKVKDGVLEALLSRDAERVTALKGEKVDKTAIYNTAYADAKKNVLPKEEKKLAEKYGIELGKKKLPELVESIVSGQLEAAKVEVNDDTVKKHPLFLKLERSKATEIEALTSKYEEALKGVETQYKRKEQLTTIKDVGAGYFTGLNPILSSDATKANNQTKRFLKQLEQFDYQEDGENHILLDSEGKRLEDAHGHPITLKQKVQELASAEFDFKVQDNKGGGGNKNKPGSGVNVPSSKEEYNKAIFEAKTVEQRATITAAYEAAGGSTE